MHIPDGLMDPVVALIGWAEFTMVIGVTLFILRNRIKERDLPRVAVLSAGIFVAQMLNFPIGGGTTGHLIGGALFAIMAGPLLAMVGMTVILLIQALMFGDGGITALGLNALNMAIIAPLSGWGIYTMLNQISFGNRKSDASRTKSFWDSIPVACSAWASVFLAACACAAELSVSYAISGGRYGIAAPVSIPTVLGYHAVIGVGEAAITVGILAYINSVASKSPSRTSGDDKTAIRLGRTEPSKTIWAAVAILVVFALALPLYFVYASEGRDGLEQTMDNANVQEGSPVLTAPFSYGENYFAALFMGMVGFVVVALLCTGMMRLLGRGNSPE